MHRVCSLRLGPNVGVQLMAEKSFYLRLMFEKIHAFWVFTGKYLWSYGSIGANFTATANCTDPYTEVQIEIVET